VELTQGEEETAPPDSPKSNVTSWYTLGRTASFGIGLLY
jgi:hypothetical protein